MKAICKINFGTLYQTIYLEENDFIVPFTVEVNKIPEFFGNRPIEEVVMVGPIEYCKKVGEDIDFYRLHTYKNPQPIKYVYQGE